MAEKTGARGTDSYSLLQEIGRNCIGAMQFLPDGLDIDTSGAISAEDIADAEIETQLANLGRVALGVDPEEGFRISIAGAQEKTALLSHEGRWEWPLGATPTTHILEPQLGQIPTASGEVDMSPASMTRVNQPPPPVAITDFFNGIGGKRTSPDVRFADVRHCPHLARLWLPQSKLYRPVAVARSHGDVARSRVPSDYCVPTFAFARPSCTSNPRQNGPI